MDQYHVGAKTWQSSMGKKQKKNNKKNNNPVASTSNTNPRLV
jgi:hypothetical protein